jgi:ATP-dependent helicase/nuclease subunit B
MNEVNRMGLRYITGRAGTGKSFWALSQIKERLKKEEDNNLILIVPEQFTLQAERDIIQKQELDGIMRAEVLSFTRLAHRVFSEVGGLTRRPVNQLGKNMILKKILDEEESKLTIYRKISKQEGFVDKFSRMICELKQHDISPAELAMELNALEEDSILKAKLADISLIYEKFNAYLENRYVDSEDHMNLLIEYIEKAPFLEGAEIWIDGFHIFTPQTLRIIEKLLLKAKDVNISFAMELEGIREDKDLFYVSQKTFLKIKETAQKLKIKEEIINLDKEKRSGKEKSPEITHIEREFYRYPYQRYDDCLTGLELFAGANLYSEIENAAAQIIALARDKKYRWRDIAVITGDLEGYEGFFKRIFEEYGIPYFMDEKREILNNPIVELILSALESIRRGYPYQEIFRFIKTGFSPLTKDEGEKLENYALRYGIRGWHWANDFTIPQGEELEELNQFRKRVIEPLLKLEKKIGAKKPVKEITKVLFEFLQELETEKKLESWIEELKRIKRYDFVNENSQIWNTVIEIFDQLSEILGDSEMNLKEYIRVLESGFLSCEIGVIPSTIDQVLVGNVERSKSHDIKALFVVGVNDGILPSMNDDGGILLDHERASLAKNRIFIGLDSETKLMEEKYAIYSAFTKPSEYLWISFALADQEGKAKRPSLLIDRFRKLFKRLEIKSDLISTPGQQLQLVAAPEGSFKYLIENLRQELDGKPIEEIWWDVYHWYYKHSQWDEKRQMAIKGFFHENQIEYIKEDKAKKLYRLPIRSSISRLESFVNCPFAHFVSYGLRPKERKEYQFKSPDMGNLFHDSMDKFSEEVKKRNILWKDIEKAQCETLVEEIMDEIVPQFDNGIMLSTYRYRYLTNRLKRISKRALWTLTEHIKRGEFEPLGHEIRFGLDQKIPPILIELEDGEKVYVEGRIDRVDYLKEGTEEYMKIIDYKSGYKDFNLSDVYYGFQMQLIVYLDAMMSIGDKIAKNRVHPAGVFYFKIEDPLIKTTEKARDRIEREINKKLKMRGLVLNDLKVIKSMDKDIEKYSDIIPVTLNKGEEISKTSSVVSEDEFFNLIVHVRNLIKEIGKEILKGNVKIEPCKKGKHISCRYCPFLAICQFDGAFQDNKVKYINELKPEEVLEKIKKEKEGEKNA